MSDTDIERSESEDSEEMRLQSVGSEDSTETPMTEFLDGEAVPAKSDMMLEMQGEYDAEEVSKWAAPLDDDIPRPPTKSWPIVLIDYSNSSSKLGLRGRGSRKSRKSATGCFGPKSDTVDVVFADQDRYSTLYGVEVANSDANKRSIGNIFAMNGLASFR